MYGKQIRKFEKNLRSMKKKEFNLKFPSSKETVAVIIEVI